ncbi:MAG: OmpH family outer membrane protein [Armatimonadota bacterium]
MNIRYPIGCIIAMMAVGISAGAHAQAFGAVDLAKVNESLVKIKDIDSQVKAKHGLFQSQLDWMQENQLLSEADYKEYLVISAVAKPNDAQKSKLTAMKDKAKQLSTELSMLRQKNPLSDTEKLRMNELTSIEKINKQYIQDYGQESSENLKLFQENLERQLWLDVRAAVTDVATRKKLSVVFTISPDTVLYASNDITDEVVKRLASKK